MECSVSFTTPRPIPSYNVQVSGTATVGGQTNPVSASIIGVANGNQFTMNTAFRGLNIRQFISTGVPPQGCHFTA